MPPIICIMKISKEPKRIWAEYQRGVAYKDGIGLYENVERNNDYYNDIQWKGVNAPDIDKPVFNIFKPVVNYYVAMLITDDIAVNIEQMEGNETLLKTDAGPVDVEVAKVLSQEVESVLELANVRTKNRRALRNCAVDGDTCFYLWFDPDAQDTPEDGCIRVEVIDNTNVYFGDPAESEPQEQPYIIIAYRRLTEDVKDEAKQNGLPTDGIRPDTEYRYMNADREAENRYTTVLLKLWRQNGSIHMVKTTEDALVKKETDTGYLRYPLAWMNWEYVKNSYHGVSPLTGKVPNQQYINKIYALGMRHVLQNAFPKVVIDEARVPQGWNNDVTKAIGVVGDPSTAIFAGFRAPDMSGQVLQMAATTTRETKDLMGANDAALGNVKPENRSAIIAVQKASGLPLDIQKMEFHNFVEDYVRVMIDMMRVNYGVRRIGVEDAAGNRLRGQFDFGAIDPRRMSLKIDIGAGSYWSELMQVQTLDSLFANKLITDPMIYFDAIPDGYIKNKNKLMQALKEQQAAQQMPAPDQQMAQPMPGSVPPPEGLPEGMLSPPAEAGQQPQELPVPDMKGAPPMPLNIAPLDIKGLGAEGMPQGAQASDRLTEEQMRGIVNELMQIPLEQAMKVLELMEISSEDKEIILKILERGGA